MLFRSKLDPGEVLRAAGDSLPQPEARRDAPPSQDIPFPSQEAPRWPFYAGAAAVIVVALAVYEFYWDEPEAKTTQPAAVASTSAAVPAKSASATVPAPLSGGEAQAVREPSVTTVEAAPNVPAPAVAAAAVSPPDAARPSRPGERLVRLDFDDESWVEIRDRNERVIFSQLNRPGTQQLVHGLPPFSIVVGNAHGVRLIYDDRPVDLTLHTKIDVARLILP